MKRILTLLVTMAALLGLTITAQAATYSSYWTEENGVWRVKDPNGNVVTNAWLCDDAVPENGKDVWYLLDANGNMLTYGIVQDKTGNYYSLEMEHNGYYGMLRYKSGTYDGVNLELESSHDGAFAAIKNEAGRNALADKYGVVTIDIDNSNIVYTSSYGNSGNTVNNSDLVDWESAWPEGGYDEYGISYLAKEMLTNTRAQNKKYGEVEVLGNDGYVLRYRDDGAFRVEYEYYDFETQKLAKRIIKDYDESKDYDKTPFDETAPGQIVITYKNGIKVCYPEISRDSYMENGKMVHPVLHSALVSGIDDQSQKLIFRYYNPNITSTEEARTYLTDKCGLNVGLMYYDPVHVDSYGNNIIINENDYILYWSFDDMDISLR